MITLTCDFCDTIFNPKPDDPEQHCPKCGAVHELPPETLNSLSDKTEMVFNDSPEIPPSEDTSEKDSGEDVFYSQHTKIVPSPPLVSRLKKVLNWKEYIPTLAVCALFLFWVLFDKIVRPHPFDDYIIAAVEALNQGDPNTALKEADRAIQIHPKSKLAQEIYDLAEKQIKAPK